MPMSKEKLESTKAYAEAELATAGFMSCAKRHARYSLQLLAYIGELEEACDG